MVTREVLVVVYDGVQSLDVSGPVEVIAAADEIVGGGAYRLRTASIGARTARSSSGLLLGVDADLGRWSTGIDELDTLVVPGGAGTARAVASPALIDAIASVAARSRRIVGVCSGAFLLAEAGLLRGKRATTHWSVADLLARLHPEIDVDPDPIYVRDGKVSTSAGVTTGMDLALALVEEDLGTDVALEVARRLVLFLRRPGTQSQFSTHLAHPLANHDRLRQLQGWIADHPCEDLTVATLAARAGYSERQLTRVFIDHLGESPARHVARIRVDTARRYLESSSQSIDDIAAAAGFGSSETMRRAFLKELGVAPSHYRDRFSPNRPATAR